MAKGTKKNGLSKSSAANALQVKSVSLNRFQSKLGTITDEQLALIVKNIMLCIGYKA
jgi:mRNA-degrading endonuclease toxin of MazEF toxin-antitoxin module